VITEIPTAEEFHAAGLNLLHLAWQMALDSLHEYEQADYLVADLTEAEAAAAEADYWVRSQPALANAFSLIQQSMELAIKGRIAAISPYLLISRDPKDWPRGVESQPTPFSEFRTLDAADLVRAHNSFAAAPFDEAFRTFWDGVRRERNVLMHSLSGRVFEPETLIVSILTVVQTLYADLSWPERLLQLTANGKFAAFGLTADYDRNVVMQQVASAIHYLTPAQALSFFGFDKRRRAYICPTCLDAADRDYQDTWPRLAQLASKKPGATQLRCVVCQTESTVDRATCVYSSCQGNVVHEDVCLTCCGSQDSPYAFSSDLETAAKGATRYDFNFHHTSVSSGGRDAGFPDHTTAQAHARLAMESPHLQVWQSVTVRTGWPQRELIGSWIRVANGLEWRPGEDHSAPGGFSGP
jgi:hypothetical protein